VQKIVIKALKGKIRSSRLNAAMPSKDGISFFQAILVKIKICHTASRR